MSTDKEVKRDTGQQPAVEESEKIADSEEVEGYTFCDSLKQKCLHDCVGNTPFLSELN